MVKLVEDLRILKSVLAVKDEEIARLKSDIRFTQLKPKAAPISSPTNNSVGTQYAGEDFVEDPKVSLVTLDEYWGSQAAGEEHQPSSQATTRGEDVTLM